MQWIFAHYLKMAILALSMYLKHLHWLTEMILPHRCQQIVLQEMIQTITERISRLERLDNELTHQVKQWRYYPVVKAIQALRGVRLLVATGVIAELGDLSRFNTPRKKCGNGRANRRRVRLNAYTQFSGSLSNRSLRHTLIIFTDSLSQR